MIGAAGQGELVSGELPSCALLAGFSDRPARARSCGRLQRTANGMIEPLEAGERSRLTLGPPSKRAGSGGCKAMRTEERGG
jgi:hypothetical protein